VSVPAGGTGLFGKLPARGDFVRSGLPGSFVTPWDAWLQTVVAASRDQLGAAWLPAWLEAPVWRFCLAPGLCGPDAVLGLMLPSVDRVGRYFPLTLAAVFPADAAAAEGGAADAWLDGAEAAGRAALEQDATQEQVAALLPPLPQPGAFPAAGSHWWTEGGPRVAPARWQRAALPDAEDFAAMLGDPAP
jgi:type VI secretion system protein ImpM